MTVPVAVVKVDVQELTPNFTQQINDLFKEASHVDIGVHSISGPELVVIAAANEFGAWAGHGHMTKVPERSYIRSTADNKRAEYQAESERLWGQVLAGALTIRQALGLLGLRAERDIKRTIQSNVPPPNADSTKKRKKSDHTLIDETILLNSIRYAIKNFMERVVELSPATDIGLRTVGRRGRKNVKKPHKGSVREFNAILNQTRALNQEHRRSPRRTGPSSYSKTKAQQTLNQLFKKPRK